MIKNEIKLLQTFLIGKGYLKGKADGDYGKLTTAAVKTFQTDNGLMADGIIGSNTLKALSLKGYKRNDYPAKPSFMPLSYSERAILFGKFRYEHAHDLQDRDAVIIKGDWVKKNIVTIDIPQLVGVSVGNGKKHNGKVRCHALVAHQFLGFFNELQEKDLAKLILTWEGSFYPRYSRGSTTVLSNHSWGTAFDINYEWNTLGATPAFLGEKGSVRELVETAWEWGFYWGGHFSRLDAMHFEVYKII